MGAKASFNRFCRCLFSNKRHALGITLILIVVFLWVGSSNLLQHIFTGGGFGKPFFTTYFSTSLFSLYLSGFLFFKKWRHLPWNEAERLNQNYLSVNYEVSSLSSEETVDKEALLIEKPPPQPPKTFKQVLIIALQFCFLWLVANFTYNYSISRTSVSSSTIISTTSSFWTLLFCHILKIEKFSLKNLLAVAIA